MEEVVIRKASAEDASAIARVHVKSWQTTYNGILEKKFLDSLKWEDRINWWEESLTDPEEGTENFVALIDDQVIGFIGGGKIRDSKNGYDAELYAIYILDEFRGLGIGRKLFNRLVKWLKRKGFSSMLVRVAEKNRYRDFYTRLGAELGEFRDTHTIGGKAIDVGTYLWKDLGKISVVE